MGPSDGLASDKANPTSCAPPTGLAGPFPLVALCAAFILGCGESSTLVDVEDVSITVEDATVDFDQPTRWVGAELRLTLTNTSQFSVWFHPCGSLLERHDGDDWLLVWSSICALGEIDEVQIGPGEQYETEVNIWAYLGRGPSENWIEPVSGEYRLTVALRDAVASLPARTSNPFQMRLN